MDVMQVAALLAKAGRMGLPRRRSLGGLGARADRLVDDARLAVSRGVVGAGERLEEARQHADELARVIEPAVAEVRDVEDVLDADGRELATLAKGLVEGLDRIEALARPLEVGAALASGWNTEAAGWSHAVGAVRTALGKIDDAVLERDAKRRRHAELVGKLNPMLVE
jgi:hypothetical protein